MGLEHFGAFRSAHYMARLAWSLISYVSVVVLDGEMYLIPLHVFVLSECSMSSLHLLSTTNHDDAKLI